MVQADDGVVQKARDLIKRGQHEEAIGLLVPWLATNPDDADGWAALGAAHFELENWSEAERAAREVVRLQPDSAREQCNLGVILRKGNRLDEAVEAQLRALSLDAGYERAEAEIAKLRAVRPAAPGPQTWTVRNPEGAFLGPLTLPELREGMVRGDFEPGWSARMGSGRVVTVREALGAAQCDEALDARRRALNDAGPQRELLSDLTGAVNDTSASIVHWWDSVHSYVRWGLIAAVLVLAGLALVLATRTALIERQEATLRQEAMAAVLDLDDAVTVGVIYADYRRRTIDARQAVRRARDRSTMPYVQFWHELDDALDSFDEAAKAWQQKIDSDAPALESSCERRMQLAWLGAGNALNRAEAEKTAHLDVWPVIASVLGMRP